MNKRTLILCGFMALASTTSFAQGVLEEVVVTAQKRSQNLQDVPLSVSAFSGDKLRELGASDFTDLSSRLNNINISSDQSDIDISIRGVSNNRGFDPATAFHIDGIYTARGVSGLTAFLDVERLEVIRGPAGTLYGRNATAGAVNVISRRPDFEGASGNIEATVGDYDHVNVQFGANIPIVDDKLGLRISGLYDDREGYNEHDGLGFDVKASDDSDVGAFKARLLFTPTDSISWLVGYDQSKVGGVGRRLLLDHERSAEGTQVVNALPNRPAAFQQQVQADPRFVPVTDPLSENIKQSAWMSELSVDFGDWNVLYLTAYREVDQDRLSDTDFFIGENFVVDSFLESEEVSHELRLSYTSDSLQWLMGLYAFESEVNSGFEQIIVPVFANFSDFQDGRDESLGVFTQATVSISDSVRATFGLRYSEDKKTQAFFRQALGNPNNLDLSTVEPFDRDPSLTFDDVSWKASLEWDVADDSLIYVTASTGYKTGGYNSDPDQSRFDEETVLAFEAGSKNQFNDGRLLLNGAIFMYDYKDLQVSGLRVINDAFGEFERAINVQDNLDGADIFGAELEWVWLATSSLQIDGGFGYLKAEVDTGRVDDTLISTDDALGGVDVSGNSLRKSPEFSFNLGLQHTLDLGRGSLRSRVDFHYEEEQYHDVINRGIDLEPSNTKTDVSLTWDSKDGWFIQAFARNLEDDDVRTATFQTPLGGISQLSAPRTYGVRAGFDF